MLPLEFVQGLNIYRVAKLKTHFLELKSNDWARLFPCTLHKYLYDNDKKKTPHSHNICGSGGSYRYYCIRRYWINNKQNRVKVTDPKRTNDLLSTRNTRTLEFWIFVDARGRLGYIRENERIELYFCKKNTSSNSNHIIMELKYSFSRYFRAYVCRSMFKNP